MKLKEQGGVFERLFQVDFSKWTFPSGLFQNQKEEACGLFFFSPAATTLSIESFASASETFDALHSPVPNT
jgi:hypothetical protein